MFLQEENSAVHQLEEILLVDIGQDITVVRKPSG
jgi:hypothetical protein